MKKYNTIFIDSISELTRLAYLFSKTLPSAISKKGEEDGFAIYRELANQTLLALKNLQHAPSLNVIFVGILDRKVDDFGRETWVPQMAGGQIARELPGIVDSVITMSHFDFENDTFVHNPGRGAHRAFVCRSPNPWGLIAKTRSSVLDMVEKADLGALLNKMNYGVVE